MKETVFTMRVYWILAGTLTILPSLAQIARAKGGLDAVIPVVDLLWGLGTLYVGICLPKLLRTSLRRVAQFLAACAIWTVCRTVLLLFREGVTLWWMISLFIPLLVIFYLFRNAYRLSMELRKPPEPSTAATAGH